MSDLNFNDEDKLLDYVSKNINYNFKATIVKDASSTRIEEENISFADELKEDLLCAVEDLESISDDGMLDEDAYTLSQVILDINSIIEKIKLRGN